jgi:N-acetylneuraminic acid mutarotase
MWRYDPASDAWLISDSLPSFGRSGCASFVLNDRLYLVGGKHALGAATDEVWTYDAAASAWIQEANFPFGALWRASACAYNGK